MYDLFNPPPDTFPDLGSDSSVQINTDVCEIPGLRYIPNYISKEEQKSLMTTVNLQTWLADIKRRVQHYGYKYDYKAKSINYSMFLGPLPPWALSLAKRLFDEKHISEEPDQVIINEYVPGQGIANHVDCEPCFGDTVISISLGSQCVMDFINLKTKRKIEVMLEPGSLVVISDEARHKWSHGISQRKSDFFKGIKYDRQLRVSMTFRKVVIR